MFPRKGKEEHQANPAASLETITPKQAADILRKSEGKNFRPLRRGFSEALAIAIKEGRWSVNGEAIILNGDGSCIDGQHRLWACVIAEMPIQSVVVRGVKDDTYIDSGMSRTVAQILTQRGFSYATVVAAVAKYASSYETGTRSNSVIHGRSDRGSLVAYATKHPEIQESARVAEVARRVCPASAVTWIHFEASRRGLASAAAAFLRAISDGAGLEQNNPALLLRNRLLSAKGTMRLSKFHMMILAVKAWNAWAAGEPMAQLKVYSGREGIIVLPEFYEESPPS